MATPGEEVAQPGPIDAGIFAHQVRATPDNRQVILVTRGHDAADGKPEEPGALKVFDFKRRRAEQRGIDRTRWRLWLRPAASGFPSVEAVGLCVAGTAERARHVRACRMARCRRRRASARTRWGSAPVDAPGRRHRARASERPHGLCRQPRQQCGSARIRWRSITIDQSTGEPNLIQHIDTHGIHPRTFHIDPSGRLMAVAHITGAELSLFRIGDDGGLHFARAYDIDVGQRTMWWMGMVEHAA